MRYVSPGESEVWEGGVKATTKLEVRGDMKVNVSLEMTVSEMDSILQAVEKIDQWPMYSLKQVLRETLWRARAAYDSEVHSE